MGHRPLGERDPNAATRNFQDRDLDELDTAYGKWADQDFPASAYREVMDVHGVDHMILYPTAGFWTTAVAEMDGETAMAIRRAYNAGWEISVKISDAELAVQRPSTCATQRRQPRRSGAALRSTISRPCT